MSEDRTWLFRISDMLTAIDEIGQSVADHSSAESLYKDRESFRAVERNFQIIAEASKAVPTDVKTAFPAIAWQDLIGMRNFLVHEYGRVDYRIVWQAVRDELPPLQNRLKDIMKTYGEE